MEDSGRGTRDAEKKWTCAVKAPIILQTFWFCFQMWQTRLGIRLSHHCLIKKGHYLKTNKELARNFIRRGKTLTQWFSRNIMHSKWRTVSVFQYSSYAYTEKRFCHRDRIQTTDALAHSCHDCLARIHAKICMAPIFTVCHRGWCPTSNQITGTSFSHDLIQAVPVESYHKWLDILIIVYESCSDEPVY